MKHRFQGLVPGMVDKVQSLILMSRAFEVTAQSHRVLSCANFRCNAFLPYAALLPHMAGAKGSDLLNLW